MARISVGATIRIITIAAACALGASNASAASSIPGPSGQGGVLAPAASPYALLAPVTLANTPGGQGRAAFEGRPSLCLRGEHEIPTDFGMRCRPNS
jgi:hypothetical protein